MPAAPGERADGRFASSQDAACGASYPCEMGYARLDEDGVSTAEAARLLGGVTQATLWRWIEEGRLPSYRVGQKLLRIRRSDIDHFIETCRVAPGSLGRR